MLRRFYRDGRILSRRMLRFAIKELISASFTRLAILNIAPRGNRSWGG